MEVAAYLMSRAHCDDVLQYWHMNERNGQFPLLCQLAKQRLSSSATSVPVESMFSITGLTANGKRSRLSSDKLHRIVFIHDNYDFVC